MRASLSSPFARAVSIVVANLAVYVSLVAAFAYWIAHEVQAEYHLGYRTSTDGDSIGLPIFGFAAFLGLGIVSANAAFFVGRWIWRKSRATI